MKRGEAIAKIRALARKGKPFTKYDCGLPLEVSQALLSKLKGNGELKIVKPARNGIRRTGSPAVWQKTEKLAAENCRKMGQPWRRRPNCGGWWEWMEKGSSRVEKLLLVPSGREVAGDDAWEQATGKRAEHDGFVENYWESTQTTQKMMPGLWRKLA